MAYNEETQGELLAHRLTARQAVPRNLSVTPPRNLAVVRHAKPPSNDEGLKYDPMEGGSSSGGIPPDVEGDFPTGVYVSGLQVVLNWNTDQEVSIVWGDGATDTANTAGDERAMVHDYAAAGSYNVTIAYSAGGAAAEFDLTLVAPEAEEAPADEGPPEGTTAATPVGDPWDSMTTHAALDQFAEDNLEELPDGWSTMKVAEKKAALDEAMEG